MDAMENNVNGQSIDDMLAKNMQQMYTQNKGYDVSDERLSEIEKKLPSWSLEPPFSQLK
jgi:hypothetical protein